MEGHPLVAPRIVLRDVLLQLHRIRNVVPVEIGVDEADQRHRRRRRDLHRVAIEHLPLLEESGVGDVHHERTDRFVGDRSRLPEIDVSGGHLVAPRRLDAGTDVVEGELAAVLQFARLQVPRHGVEVLEVRVGVPLDLVVVDSTGRRIRVLDSGPLEPVLKDLRCHRPGLRPRVEVDIDALRCPRDRDHDRVGRRLRVRCGDGCLRGQCRYQRADDEDCEPAANAVQFPATAHQLRSFSPTQQLLSERCIP